MRRTGHRKKPRGQVAGAGREATQALRQSRSGAALTRTARSGRHWARGLAVRNENPFSHMQHSWRYTRQLHPAGSACRSAYFSIHTLLNWWCSRCPATGVMSIFIGTTVLCTHCRAEGREQRPKYPFVSFVTRNKCSAQSHWVPVVNHVAADSSGSHASSIAPINFSLHGPYAASARMDSPVEVHHSSLPEGGVEEICLLKPRCCCLARFVQPRSNPGHTVSDCPNPRCSSWWQL